MTRDRNWFVVAGFLPLVFGAAVQAETATAAAPATETPLPKPQILDLFGQQPASEKNAEKPAVPESEHELKRPAVAKSTSAATTAGEQKRIDRRSRDAAGWRFWDMVPLLSVLALIVVVALILKRFLPARGLTNQGGAMEVVARMPLSGKQSLVLVKLGRRLLLLGLAPDRVSTLCIVDDPEQAAELLGEMASRRSGSMTQAFTRTFGHEAGQYVDSADEEDAAAEASGHVRVLLGKVREHLAAPLAGRAPGKPGG